jgi:hypothetical protein
MAEPYPGEPFLAYLRDAYDVLYEEGTRAHKRLVRRVPPAGGPQCRGQHAPRLWGSVTNTK